MATTCDAGDACFIHSGGALLLNEASALSSHTDEERQQQTCGLPRRLANKDLCWTRLPLSDYGPFTLSALTSPWVREAVSCFSCFSSSSICIRRNPPPISSGMEVPLRGCLPAVRSAPPCSLEGGWYGALCCHGYGCFFFLLFFLFLA